MRIYELTVLTVALTFVLVSGQYAGDPVEVKWGVADSSATVGRLFRLHIPSDAFSGPVEGYEIKTSEGLQIPKWLEFDPKENVLQGIPSPKDSGQIFLEITAKSGDDSASTSLTLFIRDVPSHASGAPLKFKKSGPEFVRCKREEPETVATIIIDTDVEQMAPSDRVALLKRFLGHMELHEDMVKVLPVGHSGMHDNNALVSGTGDCVSPKTPGTFISWPVGCGQVKTGHFAVLQRLDEDSGSGYMAKALEFPVIGWHVTNSHIQAPKRKRRQAVATATPVMTPVMPTRTQKGEDEKTDDADEKMTWTVVEMATPTMIQPTATQPEMTKTDDPVVAPTPGEVDEKPIKPTQVTTPETKPEMTPAITPSLTYTDGEPTVPLVVDTCIPGQRPEAKKTFSRLMYHAGDVIDFLIPEDAFVDCEVGNTRGLELMLFRESTEALPPDFFIQLDKKNQKIIGLPTGKDVGRYKLNLLGKKSGTALIDNFDFTLVIKQTKGKKKINHELSVTVDFDYKEFMSSVANRTALANNVASIYGDSDASNLVITKMEAGSVIYGWANKSLNSNGCPVGDISNMVGKLVNADGSLTDNAIEKLKPFTLLGAAAQPAGSCEGNPNFPSVVSKPRMMDKTTEKPMEPKTDKPDKVDQTDPGVDDGSDDEDDGGAPAVEPEKTTPKAMDEDESTTEEMPKEGAKKGDDDDDDIWITTVVPAVVIVVILLIALLIACILYRKKRKGKMNVEEQNTFVNKGAPVIFPDELEDKPSDVNKPLLVEGNAGPPPEYHRAAGDSPEPEIANNHNRNNLNAVPPPPANEDDIQEYPERPYEPPAPPVTGSSNNKQPRPTHQQQPFSQPPEILP